MVMFKGKELTLASERLRRKGLQGLSLKTRLMREGEGGGEDFEASNRSTHQLRNTHLKRILHVYKLNSK